MPGVLGVLGGMRLLVSLDPSQARLLRSLPLPAPTTTPTPTPTHIPTPTSTSKPIAQGGTRLPVRLNPSQARLVRKLKVEEAHRLVQGRVRGGVNGQV